MSFWNIVVEDGTIFFLKEKQYIIRNKHANIQIYILSFSTIGFKKFQKSTKKTETWNTISYVLQTGKLAKV